MGRPPELIEQIPHKKPSIIEADGELWKKHRELATPAFSDVNLKRIFENLFPQKAQILKEKWMKKLENKSEIDINISMECKRLTFDVIASAGFGVETGCLLNDSDFPALVDKLLTRALLFLILGKLAKLPLIFKKYWDVRFYNLLI